MMRITPSMMLAVMLRERKPCTNNNVSMMISNVDVKNRKQQHRLMVGRASNRSGVHGTHLPDTNTLHDEEGVKEEINKGSKKKEEQRKHVEETVDSHLSNSNQHPKSPPTK